MGKIAVAEAAMKDFESLNSIEYSQLLHRKLSSLMDLVDSLFTEKIKMDSWLTWVEPTLFKLILHTSSYLSLFSGSSVAFKKKEIRLFDEPSILVLFRTILENYSTFYYLFGDSISDEEKVFRINVWKYSAIKQRSEFRALSKESKQQQERDFISNEGTRKEIENSKFFSQYNQSEQRVILEGKKPRLFYSWKSLMDICRFRNKLYKDIYSFKSSYAHSEFLSVLQIKDKVPELNKKANTHYSLILVHSILCKCILDLCDIFPIVLVQFEKNDEKLKDEIRFLKTISFE